MGLTAQQEAMLTQLVRHAWEGHGPDGDNSLGRLGITSVEELRARITATLESSNTVGTRRGDGTYTFFETTPDGRRGLTIHWNPNWNGPPGEPGSAYFDPRPPNQVAARELATRAPSELDKIDPRRQRELNRYSFDNKIKPDSPVILSDVAQSHRFGTLIQGGNLNELARLDAVHGARLRDAINTHGAFGSERHHISHRTIPGSTHVGRAAGIIGVIIGAAAAAEDAAAAEGRKPRFRDYVAGAWESTAGGAWSQGRHMEAVLRVLGGMDLTGGYGDAALRRAARALGADVDPSLLESAARLTPEQARHMRRYAELLATNSRDQFSILQAGGLVNLRDDAGLRLDVGAILRDPTARRAFMDELQKSYDEAQDPTEKEKLRLMLSASNRFCQLEEYRQQVIATSQSFLSNPTGPIASLPSSPMAPLSETGTKTMYAADLKGMAEQVAGLKPEPLPVLGPDSAFDAFMEKIAKGASSENSSKGAPAFAAGDQYIIEKLASNLTELGRPKNELPAATPEKPQAISKGLTFEV